MCHSCDLFYLQVAFDEMQNKVKELNNVITQNPPDMKKLQGSVSVQVHECCLMYSEGGGGGGRRVILCLRAGDCSSISRRSRRLDDKTFG